MKITIEHLTKDFGSTIAVNDFNAVIESGELIALLGPSGCGKSTMLNMISGILPSSSGRILFDEDDVTDVTPEKRGVGLVFQNYALYPHMTVLENIAFPLEIKKVKKAEREAKAIEMAKLVHVDMLLDRKPKQLSGGQQQRVAIARALIKNPRVLLLDEPLSNLDARLRIEMREEIRRIQQETQVTTIFVTHDQEEAMSISDVIVVMKLGVVQQIGKPQDVYDDPKNLFVATFLGTPPINVLEGKVLDGKVYIGDETVMNVSGVEDQDVYIGIRPEALEPAANGVFTCNLNNVEVMGRDASVVSTHPSSVNPVVRAIISSDIKVDTTSATVKYNIKPHKFFLFNKDTEQRLYFEVK